MPLIGTLSGASARCYGGIGGRGIGPPPSVLEVLIVAGGGGGQGGSIYSYNGAGGGAGGYVYSSSVSITKGTSYTITIDV